MVNKDLISTLSVKDYRFIVRKTNLFALDLIIEDKEGKILLGLRTNAPARGFWFVPGGRVYKNEQLKKAMIRIMRDETGLNVDDIETISFHGLYEHIYDDNFFDDPTFNTHYLIAVCRINLARDKLLLSDYQHKRLRFASVDELQSDPLVHPFVKFYFMDKPPNRFL